MASETSINFPPFSPDSEPTTIGMRSKKYVERFENYLIARDVKDKVRRRAIFLHCDGEKVQDIFDTLEEAVVQYIPISTASTRTRRIIR